MKKFLLALALVILIPGIGMAATATWNTYTYEYCQGFNLYEMTTGSPVKVNATLITPCSLTSYAIPAGVAVYGDTFVLRAVDNWDQESDNSNVARFLPGKPPIPSLLTITGTP